MRVEECNPAAGRFCNEQISIVCNKCQLIYAREPNAIFVYYKK